MTKARTRTRLILLKRKKAKTMTIWNCIDKNSFYNPQEDEGKDNDIRSVSQKFMDLLKRIATFSHELHLSPLGTGASPDRNERCA